MKFTVEQNTLVAYTGTDTTVTVPNTVTRISDRAFGDNGTLIQTLHIPASVTHIDSMSLMQCLNIEHIHFDSFIQIDLFKNAINQLLITKNLLDWEFDYYSNRNRRCFYTTEQIKNWGVSFHVDGLSIVNGRLVGHYTGTLSNLSLPSIVKALGKEVFQNSLRLKHITVPNSVITIGAYAFEHCISLTAISLPDSVRFIGKGAFCNCNELQSINLPKRISILSERIFEDCHKLQSIQIPNSVTIINESAFENCHKLNSIQIPNSITSIESSAFENCASFTYITIPDSVQSISSSAFFGCNELKAIKLPKHLKSIREYTFYCCGELKNINIPDSVTSIGHEAFAGSGLTSLTIPDSVIEVNVEAFDSCRDLNKIKLPENLTCIDNQTFGECESLTSINIPNSITKIEKNAFQHCILLTDIDLPDNITNIAESCFNGCESLQQITLPAKLTNIGQDAFQNCSNLTQIIVKQPQHIPMLNANHAINPSVNVILWHYYRTHLNNIKKIKKAAFLDLSKRFQTILETLFKNKFHHNMLRPTLLFLNDKDIQCLLCTRSEYVPALKQYRTIQNTHYRGTPLLDRPNRAFTTNEIITNTPHTSREPIARNYLQSLFQYKQSIHNHPTLKAKDYKKRSRSTGKTTQAPNNKKLKLAK